MCVSDLRCSSDTFRLCLSLPRFLAFSLLCFSHQSLPQFSIKSDVWSFAVTMIEILTNDDPYPGGALGLLSFLVVSRFLPCILSCAFLFCPSLTSPICVY